MGLAVVEEESVLESSVLSSPRPKSTRFQWDDTDAGADSSTLSSTLSTTASAAGLASSMNLSLFTARNVTESIGGYRLLEEAFGLIDEDADQRITSREFEKFTRVVGRDTKYDVFSDLHKAFEGPGKKERILNFDEFLEYMNVPFAKIGEKKFTKAMEVAVKMMQKNKRDRLKRNARKSDDGWLEISQDHLGEFLTDLGDDVADLVAVTAKETWGPLRRQSILDSYKAILSGQGMHQLVGKGFKQAEDEKWFTPLCGKFADIPAGTVPDTSLAEKKRLEKQISRDARERERAERDKPKTTTLNIPQNKSQANRHVTVNDPHGTASVEQSRSPSQSPRHEASSRSESPEDKRKSQAPAKSYATPSTDVQSAERPGHRTLYSTAHAVNLLNSLEEVDDISDEEDFLDDELGEEHDWRRTDGALGVSATQRKAQRLFTSRGPVVPRGERIPFHDHEAWYNQKKLRQQRQMEWRVWSNLNNVLREQQEVKDIPAINSSSRELASKLRPFHERADEKMLKEFEGHIRQKNAREYISAEERDENEFTGFPELSPLTKALGSTPGGKVALSAADRSRIWEEKRDQNMQRLRLERAHEAHGGTHHRPQIDEKSQLIFKIFRQTDEPVHDRLWREYVEKKNGQRPRRVGGVKFETPTYQPDITQRAHELNRSEYDGQTVFERLYLAPGAGRRAEPPPHGWDEPPPGEDGKLSEEEEIKKSAQERRSRLAARSRRRQMIQEEGDLWDRLHDYGRRHLAKRAEVEEADEEEEFPYQPAISEYAANLVRDGCTYERLYKYGAGNTTLVKKAEANFEYQRSQGLDAEEEEGGPWRRRVTHLAKADEKPYAPTISPMARNMVREGDVFQRMYDARKDTDNAQEPESEFSHRPEISSKAANMVREGDVYERLHKNEEKRSDRRRARSTTPKRSVHDRLYSTGIRHTTNDNRPHERKFSKAIVVPFGTSSLQHSAFRHGKDAYGDVWDAETGMSLHPGHDDQVSRVVRPGQHRSLSPSWRGAGNLQEGKKNAAKKGKDGPFSRSPGPTSGRTLSDRLEHSEQIFGGAFEGASDSEHSIHAEKNRKSPFAKKQSSQKDRSITPPRGQKPIGARRPLPTPSWEPAEAELAGSRRGGAEPELAGSSSPQSLAAENARLREELKRAREQKPKPFVGTSSSSLTQSQSQKVLPQFDKPSTPPALSSSMSLQQLAYDSSTSETGTSGAVKKGARTQRKPNASNAFSKQPSRGRTPPPASAANPVGHPAFGGQQGLPSVDESPLEGASSLSEQHAEISNTLSAAHRSAAQSASPAPAPQQMKKAKSPDRKSPERSERRQSYGDLAGKRASFQANAKDVPSFMSPTESTRTKALAGPNTPSASGRIRSGSILGSGDANRSLVDDDETF
eukprot:gnl/MRDRNA2_/MRDRNA2_100725_c0_seq1.p1 gnl/MRDRNA2_/MRDRNA2_100725_c0~~gnl/MRDRNA2_/MRDRNA2_100725_c0_seq1.p1  ORF type:complete len:1384 (+),score=288.45 gnl/MRDRNA2_/MRDRNA2_100725_c0_seq1:66-4217(+)